MASRPHGPLQMAGIVNTEFPELAHTGLNYLSWSSDCEIWFKGKNLLRAIGKGTLLAPTDPKFLPENAQATEEYNLVGEYNSGPGY
ncbi:Splicing factor 3B subunit 1 [Hordeum vulgare]|nr:Splicing factor 3B subunit 1 [Hordeum vulgare]